MNYPHLAQRLYNSPLLLTPGKAEIIERTFRAHIEGAGALAPPNPTVAQTTPLRMELAVPGSVRTDAGYWRTIDGVAILPVIGSLVQRAGGMDAMSGLMGYNRIASQLQAALDDPRTGAILLEIDSHGGEVAGLMDLSAKVRAADKRKPTWAIANEAAFSAGYWLASSAARVSAPQSAMVGSIGVVMFHVDQSQKEAKAGVTYTPIFAGERKVDFSPHAPLSEDARAIAQAEVDRVYDSFVAHVASARGMSEQDVRDTKAGLFHAQAASGTGLLDAVESFDATMAALVAEMQRPFRSYSPRAAARIPQETQAMANEKPAGAEQPSAEALQQAQARGFAEGKTEGVRAERERISAILTHAEADGRRKLAEQLAFKSASSPDEAGAILAAAAKEVAPAPEKPVNALDAAMRREGNPKVGADSVEHDSGENKHKVSSAADVYKRRAQMAAVK